MAKRKKQTDLFPADEESQPKPTKKDDFVSIIRRVEILTPPSTTFSKAGNPFSSFAVKDTEAPYDSFKVMAFKKACDAAQLLKCGSRVTINGKFDDDDDKVFLCWGLFRPGDKPVTSTRDSIIKKNYGSIENYRKEKKAHADRMREEGYIQISSTDGTKRWCRKEDCILHEGEFKRTIDYIMDELGAARVTKELRELTRNSTINVEPTAKPRGFSKVSVPWLDAYKKWIRDKLDDINGVSHPGLIEPQSATPEINVEELFS